MTNLPLTYEEIEDLKVRLPEANLVINLGGLMPITHKGEYNYLHMVVRELQTVRHDNGNMTLIALPASIPSDYQIFGSTDAFWEDKILYYLVQEGCLLPFSLGEMDSFRNVKLMVSPDMANRTGNADYDLSPLMQKMDVYTSTLRNVMKAKKTKSDGEAYVEAMNQEMHDKIRIKASEAIKTEEAIKAMQEKKIDKTEEEKKGSIKS